MRSQVVRALRIATRGGELPVVVDAASCTEGLVALIAEGSSSSITVFDAIEFTATRVLPKLSIKRKIPSLALHPTCSSTRRGMNDDLLVLAHAVADDVVVPDDWGCCGFAGDRGLLHPELTESATAPEVSSLATRSFTAYASCNRTCEIGMAIVTGRPYRHILELVAAMADERVSSIVQQEEAAI
jgi:D-lactate dehydrogenase